VAVQLKALRFLDGHLRALLTVGWSTTGLLLSENGADAAVVQLCLLYGVFLAKQGYSKVPFSCNVCMLARLQYWLCKLMASLGHEQVAR
jgi:hypothetical protein